ncbi:MAG: hypothetical protein ABI134_03760 [Byssovorax sp.]
MKTTGLSSAVGFVMMGLAGSALVGCGPSFDHLEFGLLTVPPVSVSVGPTNVELPVGVAVGLTATPFDTDGEKMEDDVVLALIPNNPSVLDVETSTEDRSFVFFGVGPGTTSISVEVDHLRRFDIPVTVKLQPAP